MRTWSWARATGADVAEIREFSREHFAADNTGLFEIDTIAFDRNLTQALVNQFYNPLAELVLVARNNSDNTIAGWTWVCRGERVAWSDEEMASVRMVHVDMSLPARTRMAIITEMMGYWEFWADHAGIGVLCSTSMRNDQEGFLRMHERAGYTRRGSICYKRLSKNT